LFVCLFVCLFVFYTGCGLFLTWIFVGTKKICATFASQIRGMKGTASDGYADRTRKRDCEEFKKRVLRRESLECQCGFSSEVDQSNTPGTSVLVLHLSHTR